MAAPSCFAAEQGVNEEQAAFKTIHYFNLKPKYSANDLHVILDKFNKLFVRLGHPDCYYRLWENTEENAQTRYLWESFWSSKSVYDEIHENAEYRKLIRGDFIGMRKMFKDHSYFRYTELILSE